MPRLTVHLDRTQIDDIRHDAVRRRQTLSAWVSAAAEAAFAAEAQRAAVDAEIDRAIACGADLPLPPVTKVARHGTRSLSTAEAVRKAARTAHDTAAERCAAHDAALAAAKAEAARRTLRRAAAPNRQEKVTGQ